MAKETKVCLTLPGRHINAAFHWLLLVGEADAERVGRGDQQTHGGDQHIQASGSRHKPLAALRVVLQNPLVPFQNTFLGGRKQTGQEDIISQPLLGPCLLFGVWEAAGVSPGLV